MSQFTQITFTATVREDVIATLAIHIRDMEREIVTMRS